MSDLYISFYQQQTFTTCSWKMQFWGQDVEPVQADHRNLLVGSAIHATVEAYLKKEIAYVDLSDYCRTWLKVYIADEENHPITWRGNRDRRKVFNTLAWHLKSVKTMLAHFNINPVNSTAELPARVELPGTGLVVGGRIDVVQELKGGRVRVFDWKCTEHVRTMPKEQMLTYFWILTALDYEIEEGMFALTKDLSYQVYVPDTDDMQLQLSSMLHTATLIKSKSFMPTPGKHCSWCDYAHLCEHRNAKPETLEIPDFTRKVGPK